MNEWPTVDVYTKKSLTSKLLTHLNLNDRSMTVPPSVLSPSRILPTPSSQCAAISAVKIQRAFKNVTVSVFNVVELRASEIPQL